MVNTLLSSLKSDIPSKDDRRILNFQHSGYMIILGKNSFSNEKIINDHEHRECLWLHAMAARGSHVILCLYNRPEPPEEVLQYAARKALEHSHSQARTVSVSLLRDVFKPEGSGIGIFKTSKSISIEVDE